MNITHCCITALFCHFHLGGAFFRGLRVGKRAIRKIAHKFNLLEQLFQADEIRAVSQGGREGFIKVLPGVQIAAIKALLRLIQLYNALYFTHSRRVHVNGKLAALVFPKQPRKL